MALARILPTGAISGSAQIIVQLDTGADGTSIVVYWGDQYLGTGTLSAGLAQVTLNRPLATDDIIVASVATQGNQSGPPLRVMGTGVVLGPWASANEIVVIDAQNNPVTYPVSVFKAQFGYVPAALENTAGIATLNYPEFAQRPASAISFDVSIERQGGQTTVTVGNVQNQRGGTLTRWPGESSFGNTLSKSFTVAGSYQVAVRGSQNTDAEATLRTIVVSIQTPAPATPAPDPAIEFNTWRSHANNYISIFINTSVEVQATCSPSSTTGWIECGVYDNPRERQGFFENVPNGPVTIQIRKRGETDPAKYKVMQFNKQS